MGRIRAGLRFLLGRLPWWSLLLLLAAVVGAGYFVQRTARFEYHFRAAGRALDREAFEEAGEHLAGCLRLDPASGRAHFLAARVARRSGQADFAGEELTACEDLGWPMAAVRAERVLLAIQRGDIDPAEEEALRENLTAASPDRFIILEALAQGYMRTYSLMKALECLDRWAEGQPDSPGCRMRRGWVYEHLERASDAEQEYRHVLEVRPDHQAAKLHLAQVLQQQRQTAEAARLFEELRAETATNPEINLGLAQCYVTLGRKGEARTLLNDLSEQQSDDHAVLLERGKLALAEGRLPEARVSLQRATVLAPQAYEPHYQLFLCLRALGESAEAGFEEKRFKAIEADLKRMNELTLALQGRPGDAALRFRIAEIFLRRGEEAEGTRWLESVVRLAPGHKQARQLLVQRYERTGKLRQARAHRRAARPGKQQSPGLPPD